MRNSLVIEKAKQVYLDHRGQNHRLIEKAMHDLGCLTFSRRVLYSRTYKNGTKHLGWIDKYDWKKDLEQTGGNATVKERASCEQTKDDRQELSDALPQTAECQPLTSFPDWLKTVSPNMKWHWKYQQLIYDKLNDITTGRTKRLMIFLPPRHGKSELVTVRYSAWRLQHEPSMNIILGS
jgi:hypothetical protein